MYAMMILFAVVVIPIAAIVGYLNSPSVKGRRGEAAIERKLNRVIPDDQYHKVLRNIYIPKEDGKTSEIDLLLLTKRGIFVIESKNYNGYIFGSENNQNWTVTLCAGKRGVEKFQFFNPVKQNRSHINNLKKYLDQDVQCYSIICFSDNGELKDVTVNSSDIFVCNTRNLKAYIRDIFSKTADLFTAQQVDEIYNKLAPLTNVSDEMKKKHVEQTIADTKLSDVCPVCGGKLVLRTARKGKNAGNQFYGCSNYPKCKYTRNIGV